jgi:hypothetical protein
MSDSRGRRQRRADRKQVAQARAILARIAQRQAEIDFNREMRTAS